MIVPHWDRRLKADRDLRLSFIKRLDAVGLISWRRRASCHIGAFFVRKKADQIRLVLDCRPANQLHRAPPKTFPGREIPP